MLKIRCYKCKKELDRPGAILLSPPLSFIDKSTVEKYHLCVECYKEISKLILK